MKTYPILSYLLIFLLVQISLCSHLIDIKVETTQELISLYKQKVELLQLIQDEKSKLGKSELETDMIDTNEFERVLKRQEGLMRRKGHNLTEMNGFEDLLTPSSPLDSKNSPDEDDPIKKKQRLESMFYERILFSESGRNVTGFELMNVKPLTKASSGGFMTHAVLLNVDDQDMYLYDIYKNNLVNISMAEHGGIKLMAGSQHHDDMYIVAISHTNQMCEFNLTLNKIPQIEPKVHRSPLEVQRQFDPVNDTKSQEIGREDLFNKRYRNMLRIYEYIISDSKCVDLAAATNTTGIEPKHLIFYMNRGEKYYIMSDTDGYLNIFYRGMDLRSRFFTGEKEIVQILKQSLTVIVVHKHDVRFARFHRASMASKKCHSGLAELTEIIVDSNHNGFIYGATNTGEILMFKTEKLLQNPDSITCNIQGKLKVNLDTDYSSHLRVASLKNYLFAMKADGKVDIFDMTNLQSFMLRPIGYSISLPYYNYMVSPLTVPEIRTIKSFNGDLIMIHLTTSEGISQAALYECITPILIDTSKSDYSFKFPMFFVAFAAVLMFKFFGNKDGGNDFLSMILGCCGLAGSDEPRFKNKKEKDLYEIEKMVRSYTQQTDEMNKKLASKKFI